MTPDRYPPVPTLSSTRNKPKISKVFSHPENRGADRRNVTPSTANLTHSELSRARISLRNRNGSSLGARLCELAAVAARLNS